MTVLLEQDVQRSVTALIPDWQRSPSGEFSTSIALSQMSEADSSSDVKYHTSTPLAPMSSKEPAVAKSFSVRESNPPVPYDPSNTAAVEVTQVEVLEELTYDEERDRHRLELRVEKALYEAGAALRQLRDRRLYRSTHRTWKHTARTDLDLDATQLIPKSWRAKWWKKSKKICRRIVGKFYRRR